MTEETPLRVLVVEDEMLVAMMVADMLEDLGHEPVGPAMRLEQALEMARTAPIDAAVLDVNLGEGKSFPVADVLRERHVPFIFATGYGVQGLSEGYRDVETLNKPFQAADLARALEHAG
ncbi:response regulator [Caulobacter sp. 17J65-9]|uniref:response regulator n=1 Tax=Caulobacter sp. 17J65-9 TaxID=2709382 RepID=UPI0013CC190F|nr:response regulator [Caulobacter sp. 17J65-9]NEX92790.1 response regulator [Caulobacter sp. 17J65-9]